MCSTAELTARRENGKPPLCEWLAGPVKQARLKREAARDLRELFVQPLHVSRCRNTDQAEIAAVLALDQSLIEPDRQIVILVDGASPDFSHH